jgi:tetratricopeptide (TPR) repeat protein
MLLLLDNAGSADHIRPLLPGTPNCIVVATSRDNLSGLVAREGAVRISLDLLPAQQAVDLLQVLVGERVRDEPAAATSLAQYCARLPLALRIAGDYAALHPTETLAWLVEDLVEERRRLDVLEAGGDPHTAIRAVFSWSYRSLPSAVARAFRLLGLHPGHDIGTNGVAALLSVSLGQATELVRALSEASLCEAHGNGRTSMHNLLQVYAKELARSDTESERRTAIEHLLDYYLATAGSAMNAVYPADKSRRPVTPPPQPGDALAEDQAFTWLDLEQPNFTALISMATHEGLLSRAKDLAATIWRHLDTRGYYDDVQAIYRQALKAARQELDRAGEAAALTNLGLMSWRLGSLDDAAAHLLEAAAILRETESAAQESSALNVVGLVYSKMGRVDDATRAYRRALTCARRANDRRCEANALHNLGSLHLRGQYTQADRLMQRSLKIYESIGDQLGLGRTLHLIGFLYGRWGRYDDACAVLDRSRAVLMSIGDRAGVAGAMNDLGYVHCMMGHHEQSSDLLKQALQTFRDVGDRAGEANTLDKLGYALVHRTSAEAGYEYLEEALDLSRKGGFKIVEASANNGLGEYFQQHDRSEALSHHRVALGLAREVGDRYEEARALSGIAGALTALGELEVAAEHRNAALRIYADLRTPEEIELRSYLEDRHPEA